MSSTLNRINLRDEERKKVKTGVRIHGGKYCIDFVVRMSSPLTKSSCSLWHKSRRLSPSNAEHATKDSFSACIHAHTETYISIFLSNSLSLSLSRESMRAAFQMLDKFTDEGRK